MNWWYMAFVYGGALAFMVLLEACPYRLRP